MKTFVIQSFNSVEKIKKFVLILVITLFSFPAMALLPLDPDYIEIFDTCCRCGLCEATYPDSFFLPDEGKAQILVGFDIEEVQEAKKACPSSAIYVLVD